MIVQKSETITLDLGNSSSIHDYYMYLIKKEKEGYVKVEVVEDYCNQLTFKVTTLKSTS